MRWLSFAMILVGFGAASAKPSNPAFLGVGMNDIGGGPNVGPCAISTITPHSPAQIAGLRPGDVFVSIDAAPITNCSDLVAKIQQQAPGDTIDIVIRRDGAEPTLPATLLTREDVLRRRGVVGQRIIATALTGIDREAVDLSDARGKTTIVGWFDTNCIGCEPVFSKVARWSGKHSKKHSPIRVLGALGSLELDDLALKQRAFDVPLLIADAETRANMTLDDADRIYFMVIDHRGVVQHVAPIAPSADDAEAMLDELFATAEQCSRKLN